MAGAGGRRQLKAGLVVLGREAAAPEQAAVAALPAHTQTPDPACPAPILSWP